MARKEILERLSALRTAMREKGIDYYMIPTGDFHNSEYVSDYFKVREYFCGFTGSAGTLLVWQDGAGLWTDGRYFIQAGKELEGTTVELFRAQDEGVPTIEEFLKEHMAQGQVLGFDGRVLSARQGMKYENALAKIGVSVAYEEDLSEEIWKDRPPFPAGKVTLLEEALAGESVEEKLRKTFEKVEKEGADSLLLTKLDDLMWLFNIRGCDVECNPVAMSYAVLEREKTVLFLQSKALDGPVREYLGKKGVQIREYGEIVRYLTEEMSCGRGTLADPRYCSYTLYKTLERRQKPVEKDNPTELLKAVKNPVELANMEQIYLKDSVAVTKFIYWLKTSIGRRQEDGTASSEITEITAADYLEGLRRQIPEFVGLSFPTIAGYGPNAAMMHYEATPQDHAVLKPEGMLLVDSGGQYLGGTTDVTRTIVLGEITEEQKAHYTAVAAGMLQMSAARWLYGCTGRNLDILARQPVWNRSLDYKCGTGHGVGYFLNVHEGPQSLRWRYTEGAGETVLEAGMDVTNEPGIYIEGSHGIRIENVMVAENDAKNEYGQFMHFKTLTWVPLDMEAIDEKQMTEEQRMLLYGYQRKVYEKLSPYLTEEEREWLKRETKADNTFFLS